MRKALLIICIVISASLSAQISINNSHMPQSGDTLRYSIATPDTAILLNYQTSGANLIWNFDSLVA